MKKLILLIAILGFAIGAQAQVFTSADFVEGTAPNWKYTDTVTIANTADDTFDIAIPNKQTQVTFQIDHLVNSGTTTSVTATIYGSSNGGISYAPIKAWTMAATGANYIHMIDGNPVTKYRIIFDGVGTQNSSFWASVTVR